MKNSRFLIVGADPNLIHKIKTGLAENFSEQNFFQCRYDEIDAALIAEFILVAMPETASEKEQVQHSLQKVFVGKSIIWLISAAQLEIAGLLKPDLDNFGITGSHLKYDLTRAIRFAANIQQQTADSTHRNRQVQAEQELAKKSKQLEQVINAATNGFFTVNANWQFTFVNTECERITKHDRLELLGRCVWDVFPRGKDLRYFNEYSKAINNQISVHFEEYDQVFDTWLSVNAYPTDDGLAVYFSDITQQKQMQEKIFVSEQNLLAIINNTNDIIWSINKSGEIISANQCFWNRVQSLTGSADAAAIKTEIGKDRQEIWQKFFDRAFAGESFKITWDEVQNGRQVFEEISFTPIRTKNNDIIGISCFSRDITENHLQLKKIRDQYERLKQIAWTQSHEVRKPLANILGLTELLQFHPSSQDRTQLISHIEIAALELDSVIRKISDYTYGETG